MEKNNIILSELKEVCPAVANLDRRNVYSVPSGYFYDLADRILYHVKNNSAKVILETSSTPFTVPQGYFDGLSEKILAKIKQQDVQVNEVARELTEIAPVLNTISKLTPYSVPAGYFEELQIIPKRKTKVVSLNRPRRFMQYAAAAAITGIMAVGGVYYMNNQQTQSVTAEVKDFNKEDLQKLSEAEIIEYLEANSTTGVSLTNNIDQNPKVQDAKQLTDEEILNYLKENPEPGDAYQLEG